MKWLQNGNLAKLVAFFVIAVVITCTVSFAANGWQSFINNEPDSDKITTDNSSANNKVDENKDGETGKDIPVVQPTQKYYHLITGLETDIETSLKRPISICYESSNPLYGISSSYLTIEFPTEYGNTRFLSFTDEAKTLGKIGSLAPKRGYISNLATYFGGVLLSYGTDDKFEYDYDDATNKLDFEMTSGYCYTEYNSFIYTNGDLVNAFLNNSSINQVLTETVTLPYVFTTVGEKIIAANKNATTISISFSENSTTQLSYSQSDGTYVFNKNSSDKVDLLNDKAMSYTNVFILYASSATYETESDTQLIVDTNTSGTGIYATDGGHMEITWQRDTSGNLVFYNTDGEKLVINRGTSYIAYVKASSKASVKIS